MTVFDQYATYYDVFYGAKDYGSEADYVLGNIRRYAQSATAVLELGCGTGAHAVELVQRGCHVTGIDISEQMLESARKRRDALPVAQRARLELSRGDARELHLKRNFDAVVSLFHVMSYQSRTEDLVGAFDVVSKHLRVGGIVAFDFWYGPGVLTQKPETRVRELENEKVRIIRIARSELRENENCVDVNLSVLIEDKQSGTMSRVQETHTMRYLFLPEIDFLLARSGMRRLCAKGWMSDSQPDRNCWAAFVVGEKTV